MFTPSLARREKMKASIVYSGPSGSGKTLSALLTAYGMMQDAYPDLSDEDVWKKIGLVDTEHQRSKLYAGTTIKGHTIHQFYHIDLQAPYTQKRYEDAVEALKQAGCDVVIIDSLSHAWEGVGGMLDKQQEMGGRFQDWNKMKPIIKAFIKTLTESDIHILGTMRVKQDYQAEKNDEGKLEIKKLGLKPIQKDDLEYEFMVSFSIDQHHVATATKDNSNLFEEKPEKITPDHGKKLYQWLEMGVDVKAEEEKQRQELVVELQKLCNEHEEVKKLIEEFEYKASLKKEQFNFKMAEKAYRLATYKLENKPA